MQLVGVYKVDDNTTVHLIEITFDVAPEDVKIGEITQEMGSEPRDSWEVPWDEKYLDEKGEEVIGEFFEVPEGESNTRVAFFFHNIDFSKPLLTQFGELKLTSPTTMPSRLKDKIAYESPD